MITLYVKTHNKTGLKYFGKTTRQDVDKYRGSGVHWKRHIKHHGYDIKTEVIATFECKEECEKFALNFSRNNNIVDSSDWANLIDETGSDGKPIGSKGHIFTTEEKQKISASSKRNWSSEKFRTKVIASHLERMSKIPKEVLTERAKKAHLKIDNIAHGKKISEKWKEGSYSSLTEFFKLPKKDSHKASIGLALKGVAKSGAHKDSLAFGRLPEKVRISYSNIEDFRNEVLSLIESGDTPKTISEKYGVSPSWVYNLIRKSKKD